MGFADAMASVPFIIFALGVLAFFGSSPLLFVFLVGVASWERYARLTRGLVLSANQDGYAEQAGFAAPGCEDDGARRSDEQTQTRGHARDRGPVSRDGAAWWKFRCSAAANVWINDAIGIRAPSSRGVPLIPRWLFQGRRIGLQSLRCFGFSAIPERRWGILVILTAVVGTNRKLMRGRVPAGSKLPRRPCAHPSRASGRNRDSVNSPWVSSTA